MAGTKSTRNAEVLAQLEWLQSVQYFVHVRDALKSRGLGTAMSWTALRSIVEHALGNERAADVEETIYDVFEQAMLYAHRHVLFFWPDNDTRDRLEEFGAELRDITDVLEAEPDDGALWGSFTENDFETTNHLVRGIRNIVQKSPVEQDMIKPEFRDDLVGNLILERTLQLPVLDRVLIPADPAYPVAVYPATNFGSTRTREEPLDVATQALQVLCYEAGCDSPEEQPMNIFPVVRSIYEDTHEGIVRSMSFECSSGAARNERMLKREHGDLRDEVYHKAGVKTTDVNPYALTVQWTYEEDDFEPEEVALELRASKRSLHDPDGRPLEVAGSHATTDAGHQYVMERLLAHIAFEDEET